MRGMFLKDLFFVKQQKRMFLIIIFMFLMFYILQGIQSAPFVISYVTLLGGMLALNTISYDEYENSIVYLFTMPVLRKEYVREKYLFGILGLLCFGGIATIAYIILDPGKALETLVGAFVLMSVMLVFEMIMLPIQLKFGGDKSRIALIGIVIGAMLILFLVKSAADKLVKNSAEMERIISDMIERFTSVPPWIIAGCFVLVLAAGSYISYSISLRIMEKKEY